MTKKSNNNSVSRLNGVAQAVAHEEPSEMQYVERRGNIFWFRRRAPAQIGPGTRMEIGEQLTKVGRNGYIRFSLETSDRTQAGKLARRYAHLFDEALERLLEKFHQQFCDPGSPSPEEIRHAAEYMYSVLLAADEDSTKKNFAGLLAGEDGGDVPVPDRYKWSSGDLPPPTPQGQLELIQRFGNMFSTFMFLAAGKVLHEITPDLLPFADAFRRYVAAIERRKASEDVPTPALPVPNTIWSWEQAFAYYFEQRKGLGDSTEDNYRLAWFQLAEQSKVAPGALLKGHVIAWKDWLVANKHERTAKARLTSAAAIWRVSRSNEKFPLAIHDPFDRVEVNVRENKGTSRRAFSAKELEEIFARPPLQTARAISVQAGYWLPLLALFHGARLDELAGLEVRDVEDNEICGLVLHIRENTIRPKLKNRKHSERSIPVHPELLSLGFAVYVQVAREAGVQGLFPSLSSGQTFGEGYVSHIKGILGVEEGRLVGMHCFRHCFATARRNARVDLAAANYIEGRPIESGSAVAYGGPAGLAILLEELRKVEYPLTFQRAPTVTTAELVEQNKRRLRALRP